jgi:hypothetical protein
MRPKVGFWAAARSVPTVMMMKPASSPRRRPTPAEGRLLGGGPQCADGDDDEAGELPARRRREPLFGTIFPPCRVGAWKIRSID